MSEVQSLEKKYVRMPSYLQELIKSEEFIYLLHFKRASQGDEEDEEDYVIVEPETVKEVSSLDLTGQPLHIDLADSELSFSEETYNVPDNWSKDETKHYAIPVDRAREILNDHIRSKQLGAGDSKDVPIFCVCDGSDSESTVLLGNLSSSSEFTQFIIQAKGLYPLSHCSMDIDNMIDEHIEDLPIPPFSNLSVEKQVTCNYSLYGHRLQKHNNWEHTENPGSIQMEVTWKKLTYDLPENVSTLKILLQVIAGHPYSKIYHLWEEIILLKSYIDSFESIENDDDITVVSNTDNDVYDIIDQIEEALLETRSVREMFKANTKDENINVHQLRNENILDILYKLVKHCSTTEHLKMCFHKFFGFIAQNQSVKIFVGKDNKSTIANTTLNILNGTSAVPTLTPKQALEFLIELGLEKLRQDYFHILHHFECARGEDLMGFWNELMTTQIKQKVPRRTTTFRRRTWFPTSDFITSNESMKKITIIAKMHVISEFMLMIGEYLKNIPEITMDCIIQSITKNYMKNCSITDFSTIENNRICNIIVPLVPTDTNLEILRRKLPTSWMLTINTTSKTFTSVHTKFLLTRRPIFPPCIVKNYDSLEECEEDLYHVTKFTILTDNFQ